MSHTIVKTTYEKEGAYASTEETILYCHHNHSGDYTIFYDEKGNIQDMAFFEWSSGNDLRDAMERLWFPFKDKWGDELKDGVEYCKQELDQLLKSK